MRSTFLGYYPPNEEELTELWDQGRIVFDTNVLLSLFRYSATTRDEFFDILDGLKGRLWIPHHVGYEFHNRRHQVVHEQATAFDEVTKALTSAFNTIDKALKPFDRHPSMPTSDLQLLAKQKHEELSKALDQARERHSTEVQQGGVNDDVLDRITALFTDVGEAYTPERLTQAARDAKERYEKKLPPGYMDAGKRNDNEHGDYIIWRQILDWVEQDPQAVIFVTDDQKEDWWQEVHGQTKGPRPELVQEFAAVCGKRLHLYTSKNFIRLARERKNETVLEEAVREVGEIAAMDRVEAEFLERIEAERRGGQTNFADSLNTFERLMRPRYSDRGDLTLHSEVLVGNLDEIEGRLGVIGAVLAAHESDDMAGERFSTSYIERLMRERDLLKVRQRQLIVERDLAHQNELFSQVARRSRLLHGELDEAGET